MDSHLLHLWKPKAGLEWMWQLRRWNTTLRRRMTQLNKEIETHVATLSRQNWESLCNRLEPNMSLPQTWNLFRHLIHSTQCKTHQKQIMTKLIHASEASPQELLQKIRGAARSTSTARLLNLGTHSRFQELAEATLTAQLTRLSGTATGRTLLCQLGIAPISHSTEAAPLPPGLYCHLVIPAIPKNMHPEHDGKHRADRAKALYKQYGDSSELAYVDVARYSSGSCMVLAVANNQARLLASGSSSQTHPKLQRRDILTHYRDTRRLYAPPALSLILTRASHWCRLQTHTAPYSILLHARYPDQFLSSCKVCGKPGDFLHVLLTCPTLPHAPSQTPAESHWETLLASSTATDQRLIIAAVMKRIAFQGPFFVP
ncbi:hypothetical protein HPB49_007000 [Dermacentor silvarum]|uniref:Uncharacterized protein n=1 Tax=Dermacentor silvarum TaxID=543639 RepID=A0ACB8C7Y6_DERSI|nr:hypothetical protein HPB49_007000 [Dermacentor silvarum]